MTGFIAPQAHVRLLIRAPASTVFAALTSADTLTKFWLAECSGPLAPGRTVRWKFLVEGATVDTTVVAWEIDRELRLKWSDGTAVNWTLEPQGANATLVEVVNSGFQGDVHEATEVALEATQGFTLVLCDLKHWLEHGTIAYFVRDKAQLIASKQGKRLLELGSR